MHMKFETGEQVQYHVLFSGKELRHWTLHIAHNFARVAKGDALLLSKDPDDF